MKRFHVQLGNKRTTVSLDKHLSIFLAIKLKQEPETTEAYTAIKDWMQAKIDEQNDPDRTMTSRWLRREALLCIADKKLSSKFNEWMNS